VAPRASTPYPKAICGSEKVLESLPENKSPAPMWATKESVGSGALVKGVTCVEAIFANKASPLGKCILHKSLQCDSLQLRTLGSPGREPDL
jgi:hypothetical protein